MIDEILNKISPEEALEILGRLAKKDSDIAQQIEKEAVKLLKKIDLEQICREVFSVLDGINVHELWDRLGPRTDGYSSPEEMAGEMMEEELDPYNKQVIKYLELGMAKEAKLFLHGCFKRNISICARIKIRIQRLGYRYPRGNFRISIRRMEKKNKE